MNEFLYALGFATWKIGSDKHYNLLKDHFTPKMPKVVNFRIVCPSCDERFNGIYLPPDVKCCPNCGQRWCK